MDELGQHPCIRVKRKNVRLVFENSEKIRGLFSVRLSEKTGHRQDVSKLGFVFLSVEPDKREEKLALSDVVSRIQVRYIYCCSSFHSTQILVLRCIC